MKTAYLYCRVSTDKQARKEYGLEAQEKVCREEALKRGIDADHQRLMIEGKMVDGKFTGVSGSTELEKRPAWKALIARIGKGDVMIISDRSRVARDIVIMHQVEALLQKAGAALVSVAGEGSDAPADDPDAGLHKDIVDAINTHGRKKNNQRTLRALAAQRDRGERSAGRVPYGYRIKQDDKHVMMDYHGTQLPRCGGLLGTGCKGCRNIEKHPDEQEIIKLVVKLTKTLSPRKICVYLDEHGFKKRNGKPWIHPQIRRLQILYCENKKPTP